MSVYCGGVVNVYCQSHEICGQAPSAQTLKTPSTAHYESKACAREPRVKNPATVVSHVRRRTDVILPPSPSRPCALVR